MANDEGLHQVASRILASLQIEIPITVTKKEDSDFAELCDFSTLSNVSLVDREALITAALRDPGEPPRFLSALIHCS